MVTDQGTTRIVFGKDGNGFIETTEGRPQEDEGAWRVYTSGYAVLGWDDLLAIGRWIAQMSPDRAAIEKSRSRPIPVIRRRADLIAACCELQQLADDPGCSDTLLVALHLAMDTMSDDGRMTPDRAAKDAASLSNPIIAEADAIRIALRWFPWYTQQATELDRAAYDCLSETLIANGWLPPSKYQTETVKR